MITLPPAIYDHSYDGPVIETILSLSEIKDFCNAGLDVLACVPFPPNFSGDKCFIYLPKVSFKVSLQDQMLLRRHEIGHCNGWRH